MALKNTLPAVFKSPKGSPAIPTSPPQVEVIEAMLKHGGLWHSPPARASRHVEDLVLELDAAFADGSLESLRQADEPQELSCVDIDRFLERRLIRTAAERLGDDMPKPWDRDVFCMHRHLWQG